MAKFDNDPDNDYLPGPKGGLVRRCRAPRTNGQRCGQVAMQEQWLCRVHGGKIQRNIDAAERRMAEARAEEALKDRKLWRDDSKPTTNPAEEFAILTGRLRDMVETIGPQLDEDDCVCCGRTNLDSTVATMLQRVVREYRGCLVDIQKLGLEERRIQLEEFRIALMVEGMKAGLAAVGITEDNEDQLMLARDAAIAKVSQLAARGFIYNPDKKELSDPPIIAERDGVFQLVDPDPLA